MATQIVMDRTGDTRHYNDHKALAKAEERFNDLTKVGFTAAARAANGEVSVVRRSIQPQKRPCSSRDLLAASSFVDRPMFTFQHAAAEDSRARALREAALLRPVVASSFRRVSSLKVCHLI
jgi:hypothetical protein